jgi:hypothetical protein
MNFGKICTKYIQFCFVLEKNKYIRIPNLCARSRSVEQRVFKLMKRNSFLEQEGGKRLIETGRQDGSKGEVRGREDKGRGITHRCTVH